MSAKIDPNSLSATELCKAHNIRLWYWPGMVQPYRVHTRKPGKPYGLHSAHDTKEEAAAEFQRVVVGGQKWSDQDADRPQ